MNLVSQVGRIILISSRKLLAPGITVRIVFSWIGRSVRMHPVLEKLEHLSFDLGEESWVLWTEPQFPISWKRKTHTFSSQKFIFCLLHWYGQENPKGFWLVGFLYITEVKVLAQLESGEQVEWSWKLSIGYGSGWFPSHCKIVRIWSTGRFQSKKALFNRKICSLFINLGWKKTIFLNLFFFG